METIAVGEIFKIVDDTYRAIKQAERESVKGTDLSTNDQAIHLNEAEAKIDQHLREMHALWLKMPSEVANEGLDAMFHIRALRNILYARAFVRIGAESEGE